MSAGNLITLGGNLEDPRNAKASDFPAVGPMGAAGESSGAGQLVKQTTNQEGPRNTQDSGDQTPSVWGKDGEFTVTKNKGEGAGQSSLSYKGSVDFETGSMVPNAVAQTY
jgi:hypothetical protein